MGGLPQGLGGDKWIPDRKRGRPDAPPGRPHGERSRAVVDIEAVLLDRVFSPVGDILEMGPRGVKYITVIIIMQAGGNYRLGDIIKEVDAGGEPVRQYAMHSRAGRRYMPMLAICLVGASRIHQLHAESTRDLLASTIPQEESSPKNAKAALSSTACHGGVGDMPGIWIIPFGPTRWSRTETVPTIRYMLEAMDCRSPVAGSGADRTAPILQGNAFAQEPISYRLHTVVRQKRCIRREARIGRLTTRWLPHPDSEHS